MNHHNLIRATVAILATAASAVTLGGCVVSANPNGYYHPSYATYGYATAANPNAAYYNGGYHSGIYYRPGYYNRTAPFVAAQYGYAAPTVYAGQNTYVAPTTYAQPVYARPAGVYVGGSVATPVVGVGGGVGVGIPRVGVAIQ